MGRVIAIANQKGGVGKTTTAINLSSALAHYGRRVLLVDFDPQGNAGRGLGFDVTSLATTIYDAVIGEKDVVSVLRETDEPNLHLIPSNLRLATLDARFIQTGRTNPFGALRSTLAPLKAAYDYIIIDCPPSLGLLNINALVASDTVISPVQCEYFAMEAVAAILSSISRIQADYNPGLRIEGFLLTMYDQRTASGTEVARQVRGLFRESTFQTAIPRNVAIPDSALHGEPVTSFKPTAHGAVAYFSLAREVMGNG